MNIDPKILQDAIVLQAVQAANAQRSFEQMNELGQRAQQLQNAVDTLAKDRQEQRHTYEARIAELTELSNANAEALEDVAKHLRFSSVAALLASIKTAPTPTESEGGEAS